jgi:hypothetical protein
MDPVELPASAYQQLEKTPTGHRDGSSEALDGRGLGTCDSVTKLNSLKCLHWNAKLGLLGISLQKQRVRIVSSMRIKMYPFSFLTF